MNRHHPIWTGRLRAPEPSPTEGSGTGGGADAPVVVAPVVKTLSIGAEIIKRGADRAAERAKNTPGADIEESEAVEVEEKAGDDGVADDEAAEIEKLRAEKEALEKGEAAPVAELTELQKLRAEVEALKAAKPVDEKAVPAAPSLSRFADEAALRKHEDNLYFTLDWAADNADGFEGKNASGLDVCYTAEDVKAMRRQAERDLRTMPQEREKLAEARTLAATNRKTYPSHFNGAHPDSKMVAELFAEQPQLAGNHKLAAEIIAGRKALAVKRPVAVVGGKARVTAPVVSPGAAPLPTRKAAPVFDKDSAAQGKGGWGSLIMKRNR